MCSNNFVVDCNCSLYNKAKEIDYEKHPTDILLNKTSLILDYSLTGKAIICLKSNSLIGSIYTQQTPLK